MEWGRETKGKTEGEAGQRNSEIERETEIQNCPPNTGISAQYSRGEHFIKSGRCYMLAPRHLRHIAAPSAARCAAEWRFKPSRRRDCTIGNPRRNQKHRRTQAMSEKYFAVLLSY